MVLVHHTGEESRRLPFRCVKQQLQCCPSCAGQRMTLFSIFLKFDDVTLTCRHRHLSSPASSLPSHPTNHRMRGSVVGDSIDAQQCGWRLNRCKAVVGPHVALCLHPACAVHPATPRVSTTPPPAIRSTSGELSPIRLTKPCSCSSTPRTIRRH